MSDTRSVRYRRLAMQETDPAKARVLHQLAAEADQGILFTADWKMRGSQPASTLSPNLT